MKQVGLIFGLLVSNCLGSQLDEFQSNRLDETLPSPLPGTDQAPPPPGFENLMEALLMEQEMLMNGTMTVPSSPNVHMRMAGISGLVNLNIDVPPPYEQAQGWLDLFERVASFFQDKDKLCAASDTVVFMEGNGCTQNQVGSMKGVNHYGDSWHYWDNNMQNIKKMGCFDNDEARSLLILPGVKKDTLIYLADHPTNPSQDDRTLIRVLQDIPPLNPYCVQTFEREMSDPYVNVFHWHKNGLDGKVSRIAVWNPKTCPWPEFCNPIGNCHHDNYVSFCPIWAKYEFCRHATYGSWVKSVCKRSCRVC